MKTNLIKTAFLGILMCSLLTACQQTTEEVTPEVPVVTKPDDMIPIDPANDSTLAKGTFVNAVHSVSGMAQVYKTKDGKRILSVENFKSDGGPDLRVYLSKDTKAGDFFQLGLLPTTSGKFSFEISSAINIEEHKYILIWCRQYSVHFGNAELKK